MSSMLLPPGVGPVPPWWLWIMPPARPICCAAGCWLLALNAATGSRATPALRILLLERHGQTGDSWWRTLFHQGGWDDETLLNLLPVTEPEELPPLTLQHRLELFTHALGKYGTADVSVRSNALLQQRLETTGWAGDPLYLAMAAQIAVEHGSASALSLSKAELALRIAERERMQVLRNIQNGNADQRRLLPHLVAMVTICQGLDRTRLMRVIEGEKAALGYDGAGSPGMLADLLSQTLPSDTAGGVWPIQPDMIGEAFILNEWQQGSDAVLRAFQVAGTAVAAFVIHCVEDFARAKRAQPVAWLTVLLAQPDLSTQDLFTIADRFPQSSVALMEHAVQIQADLVSRLQATLSLQDSADARSLFANALNNYAVSLGNFSRREEALQQAQLAVEIYRELAAARPEAFKPDLAMSLNNLAIRLSDLGRREEALQQAQLAVELLGPYFQKYPMGFRDWMAKMIRQYLALCDRNHSKPNHNLLMPLVAVFAQLSDED